MNATIVTRHAQILIQDLKLELAVFGPKHFNLCYGGLGKLNDFKVGHFNVESIHADAAAVFDVQDEILCNLKHVSGRYNVLQLQLLFALHGCFDLFQGRNQHFIHLFT